MTLEEIRISNNPHPPGAGPVSEPDGGKRRRRDGRGRPCEPPNVGEPEEDDGAPTSAPPPAMG